MRGIPPRYHREGRENREVLVPNKSQLVFVPRVQTHPDADVIQLDLCSAVGAPFLDVKTIDEFVIPNGYGLGCWYEM